jgi:hypothetical protein
MLLEGEPWTDSQGIPTQQGYDIFKIFTVALDARKYCFKAFQ